MTAGPGRLPRRRGQAHLEPQLREPHGAGSGTAFDAFGPDADAEVPNAPAGSAAAAFHEATHGEPDDAEDPDQR